MFPYYDYGSQLPLPLQKYCQRVVLLEISLPAELLFERKSPRLIHILFFLFLISKRLKLRCMLKSQYSVVDTWETYTAG